MKPLIIVFAVSLIIGCSSSSRLYQSRVINVKGEYLHKSTKTAFPNEFNSFIRKSIRLYDKDDNNISVDYEDTAKSNSIRFTIYLYPAGIAWENRLKDEYLASLQAIATVSQKELIATQHPFRYENGGFKVVGISSTVSDTFTSKITTLTIFECGKWFLKYRITYSHVDDSTLEVFQNKLFKIFSPTELVRKYPLKQKQNILVAPAAFNDSTLLYVTLEGAFEKAKWVIKNIDSLERCSGYPGLYLEEHTSALQDMVTHWKETKYPREKSTDNYFSTIEKISNAGFLDEFVCDEYDLLLLMPDNLKLDYEDYYKWRNKNLEGFNLDSKLYIIQYTE